MTDRKKDFEETLNVTVIDAESIVCEEQKRRTLPFSQAVNILLETEEGRELKEKREDGLISGKEFQAGVIKLANKYKELILV